MTPFEDVRVPLFSRDRWMWSRFSLRVRFELITTTMVSSGIFRMLVAAGPRVLPQVQHVRLPDRLALLDPRDATGGQQELIERRFRLIAAVSDRVVLIELGRRLGLWPDHVVIGAQVRRLGILDGLPEEVLRVHTPAARRWRRGSAAAQTRRPTCTSSVPPGEAIGAQNATERRRQAARCALSSAGHDDVR